MGPIGGAIDIATRYFRDKVIPDQKINIQKHEHGENQNLTWEDGIEFGFK